MPRTYKGQKLSGGKKTHTIFLGDFKVFVLAQADWLSGIASAAHRFESRQGKLICIVLVYVKYTLDKYLKKFFLSDQFVGIW
jgi:hypothetical protein